MEDVIKRELRLQKQLNHACIEFETSFGVVDSFVIKRLMVTALLDSMPQIYLDGDVWCALIGDNIQTGICAFANTPQAALNGIKIQLSDWLDRYILTVSGEELKPATL